MNYGRNCDSILFHDVPFGHHGRSSETADQFKPRRKTAPLRSFPGLPQLNGWPFATLHARAIHG